jgi:hypothetical protein
MEERVLRIILRPRRRRLRPEWGMLHDEEICVTYHYSIVFVKSGGFTMGMIEMYAK